MSEVLMKTIANCETGEVIEVPLSPEEIAEHEAIAAASLARQAELEAAEAARAAAKASAEAKLAAIGLTPEEIAAL